MAEGERQPGAQELASGMRALRAGALTEALVLLESAAAVGSREAHMALAGLYLRGGGVPRNAPQAHAHLAAAATDPWPPADSMLAACDRSGMGVVADAGQAWRRLRRAMDAGQAAAWRNYGMLRALAGDGSVARAALGWALANGDRYSAHVLGLLALDAGDRREAAAWFESNPGLEVSRRRRARLSEPAGSLPQARASVPDVPDADPWPQRRPAPEVELLGGGEVQVQLSRNALSRIECDHLITIAAPSMVRSMVVDPRTGAPTVDPVRTSDEMAFVDAFPDLVVHEAELRLAAAAGHSLDLTEPLVSLRYAPGGQYLPHHDFYDDATLAAPDRQQVGQRVATVIAYLMGVERGGGTAFPRLGIEVAPEEGAALSFRNIDSSGARLEDSLHAGLPVAAGEKWIATLWCSTKPVRHSVFGSPGSAAQGSGGILGPYGPDAGKA